ncbi:MAG: response regulator transcription factor [Ekhidna sp.]|nr:response regulator transcription factor [Ekhidna sp.]
MSRTLRCVVVDDEPLAIEVITSYLEQLDNMELVMSFQNPIKAFEYIRNNHIDVLFMDIQMPKLTGLDILRSIPSRPQVIITTAYRDYALEGFELEVVDYLLKPISLDRFIKAISKLQNQDVSSPQNPLPKEAEDSMFFKVDKKMVKVVLSEIQYIESQRDYLKIVHTGEDVITKMGIGEAEDLFPNDKFIRVHRSFIIAKDKITSFSQSELEVGSMSIPVGRNHRARVFEMLNILTRNNR